MAWTSDDLAAQVRLRAQLPDAASDGAFTDADLLAFADDEVSTRLVPALRDARENYNVATLDYSCDGATVDFALPARSQSGSLRDVLLVGSSGSEGSIPQVQATQMWRHGSAGPLRFCVLGDVVRLLGETPSSDYTLRLRYYRRPSKLVDIDSCGHVTSITADTPTTGRTEFSCLDVPTAFSTAATKYDYVQEVPSFAAWGDSVALDNVTTGAAGAFDVLSASLDGTSSVELYKSSVADGYATQKGYWCPEGLTCVSPVPSEWFPLLVRLTVTSVLEAKGDRQGANSSWIVAERLLAELKGVIQPRVDGEAKRVINRNSPLRYRRNRGR